MKRVKFLVLSFTFLWIGAWSLKAQIFVKSNSIEIQSSSTPDFADVALKFTTETNTNYDISLYGQEDFSISETNVAPRFTIKKGGNIGLGTLFPDQLLHVHKGSAGAATANPNSIAVFENNTDGYLSILHPAVNESGIIFGNEIDNPSGSLIFNRGNEGGFSFNNEGDSLRMVITNEGKVGIGLSNPSEELTVNGDLIFSDGTGGFSQGNIFNVDLLKGADDLRLAGSDNGSGDHLIISASGNVGVGVDPVTEAKIKVETMAPSTDSKTAGEFRSKYRGIASFVSNEGAQDETYGILSTSTGAGSSWGAYLDGSGSTTGSNYGVYGRGDNSGSGNAYGVYGEVSGTSTRYAVYGKDNGVGGTSYAGYFEGKVAITDLPAGTGDFVLVDGNGNLLKGVPSANLISTITNLQAENNALRAENEEIKTRLDKLEALVQQLATDKSPGEVSTPIATSGAVLTDARLEQNQPNPFNGSTTVRYFIPQDVRQAEIRITDLTGKVIKNMAIQDRGEGQITFDSTTLSSGNYQYSLFINGRLLETKQMVLSRN